MSQEYAGYLGCLAMVVALTRGVMHNAGIEVVVLQAIVALFVFALVGLVVGTIAGGVVDESVRTRLEKQLAEADEAVAS